MYNLDYVVKMYFHSVSARAILNKEESRISYAHFPKDEFVALSRAYLSQYSDTEDRQLYEYIQDSVQEEGHPYAAMRERGGLNVFAALEELAEQLLTLENNEVLCRYSELLRFREISRYVEEDLLVCSFLAVYCRRYGKNHQDFGWDFAVGHNNTQLDRLMEKGLSENHFHLFGSAPSFHLIWLFFMNHADDDVMLEWCRQVDAQRRMTREHYGRNYSEELFAAEILRASLIRVCLVAALIELDREKRKTAWQDGTEEPDGDYEEKVFDDREIVELLSGRRDILERRCDIQKMIDRVRDLALWKDMGEVADYALYPVKNAEMIQAQNRWAAGERWLVYRMLAEELNFQMEKTGLEGKYFDWFYAYLVIKQAVRNEIIQTNRTVGFENFSIYTRRKSIYHNGRRMVGTAVYSSVRRGNVKSLELRVTPRKKAYDNAAGLQEIDNVIKQIKKMCPDFRYYYVLHFTKSQDEPLGERKHFDGLHCRHYKKRQELVQTANEICSFRENYRKQASRVLGIDACSQEIGCRPEVFATVFRFLANHTVEDIPGTEKVKGMKKVCQLRMTYHVGEDFLDIVDGLRAVNEAIAFLNLRCGDRIGHGTVLGLDVAKWYEFKSNTLILKQQDYLDNVVWLYHKLVEYRIEGFDNLREWLLREFHSYFAEIYPRKTGENREPVYSNISTYYEAWKLRGDDPELYVKGSFDKSGESFDREWRINRKFPEKQKNREREEVGELYYLYHYDWDVRKNGGKSIQKYVSPLYVEGVAAVQKAMQKEFAAKGIGIEANPSSNFAISTMQKYSEHPLVRLYNKDLTWDLGQLTQCPQVNISINTDDKGIFHTSLENEYALMACAMEKERNEQGNPMYNRQMIYQWLDNIREMGNMQSFKKGGS